MCSGPVSYGAGDRTRFAFLPLRGADKNLGSHRCLHWWQELSTGQFHCYGFEPVPLCQKRKREAKSLPLSFMAYTTQFDTMQRKVDERCIR